LARLTSLSEVGGKSRPGLVHRLDKDTSGLVVVAKNDMAHHELQRQIQERSLGRTYHALCWGRLEPDRGSIELPLGRHPRDRKRQAVRQGGRFAKTDYETEQVFGGAVLLRVTLQTGRTHQIRVHLAHLGHPVLADPVYGGGAKRLKGAAPEHRHLLKAVLAVMPRQALHAGRLSFAHPRTGEALEFESPLPPDFQRALAVLSSVDSA
jgi:23S rRNA pseudouridine1911/1915/1917 synthase